MSETRSDAARNGNRTRRGEDRRRAILDAARRVFAVKGYANTSMAEIAAAVGFVEGAIYKHFASKRELMYEAMGDFYEPQMLYTREHVAGIAGTRNKLRFVIWRHFDSFVKNPGLCRLIIHDMRPHEDYYGSAVYRINRELTSVVVTILDDAIKAGELRPGVRPIQVRDVIFGGIEHIAWKLLTGRATLDVDGETDSLTEFIMRGIEARPSEGGSHELERLRAQVDRLEQVVGALHPTEPARAKKRNGR